VLSVLSSGALALYAAPTRTAASIDVRPAPSAEFVFERFSVETFEDGRKRVHGEFSQAMGKKCGFCHVANPAGTEPRFDFPSDARREKQSARTMILMTRTINEQYIPKVPEALTTVSCWTCHRGSHQPDVVPSLPAETR